MRPSWKDPGSWNRYAYVGGDPINYNNDITGLSRNDLGASEDRSPYDGDWFGLSAALANPPGEWKQLSPIIHFVTDAAEKAVNASQIHSSPTAK